MSRRVVRRTPLSERIQAYLNPGDFLLWLSEELNSTDWEDFNKNWSTIIGLGLNLIFILARANSTPPATNGNDVFDDYDEQSSGWFGWFYTFIVHCLTLLSITNSIYTFYRRRRYRLFEFSGRESPNTPSARRVKVDSSPAASSPLRFLSDMLPAAATEPSENVDTSADVWEVAVWDPTPVCLRLFVLFSPGHVLIAMLFLPFSPIDPRPSVTVVKTILLSALLSLQGHLLQQNFSQQNKDSSLIHQEVLHEYNSKFVHPTLQHPVREVSTQTLPTSPHPSGRSEPVSEVEMSQPYVVIQRGFHTNPSPTYASQCEPGGQNPSTFSSRFPRSLTTPNLQTSSVYSHSTFASSSDPSSPLRPPTTFKPFPSPQRPQYSSTGSGSGDGGSLGVYSHAASPLRKAASSNVLKASHKDSGSDGRRKEGSPLKRMSTPADGLYHRSSDSRHGGASRRDSGLF